jgi:hypothetical protein
MPRCAGAKENEAVKPGILCLLLVSGCSFLWPPDPPPIVHEYALTWTCRSPEGCERMDEVRQIDRATITDFEDVRFTSALDESFGVDTKLGFSFELPPDCSWLYFLTFFGHELERLVFCRVPGGFELDLAIPNQDPATSSLWLVEGRDVDLL